MESLRRLPQLFGRPSLSVCRRFMQTPAAATSSEAAPADSSFVLVNKMTGAGYTRTASGILMPNTASPFRKPKTVEVKNLKNETVGEIELDPYVFDVDPRQDILHRIVTWQLARRRGHDGMSLHKTKERSELSYSRRKLGPQKGSGNARHGDRRANMFRGGYKSHGPVLRDFTFDLPKRVLRLGGRMALSSKVQSGQVTILDSTEMATPKTRDLKASLESLSLYEQNVLVMDARPESEVPFSTNFEKAARNLLHLKTSYAPKISVYEILRNQNLVLTRGAIEQLHTRFEQYKVEEHFWTKGNPLFEESEEDYLFEGEEEAEAEVAEVAEAEQKQ